MPPALRRIAVPALALAAGLSLASGPAAAQQTPTIQGQAGSAAQAAPQAPALPEPYLAAEHRDWQVLCTRIGENGQELCEMYQLLTESNGQPIAEISIAALAEGGDIVAGATITTPLETFLPSGLGFRIGANAQEIRVEAFRVCTVIGCIVRMGLTPDEIAQMQRGSEAFITIVPFVQIDQPVDIRVSLLGFTAALREVRARTPNPPTVTAPDQMPLAVPVDPSTPPATPPAAQD